MQRRTFLAAASLPMAGNALAQVAGIPVAAGAPLQGTAFIIQGFPPGGTGETVARPLAEWLRGRYATNVVVDSKPGAGGRIAVDYVKRSNPDGLTILQIPSSVMTLYPSTHKKLTYNPFTDFIPVTGTASFTFVLTAGPGTPAEVKTLPDYIRWVKTNPRGVPYGVPALGSAPHFAGMLFQRAAGLEMQAVGYKGGAPLLNDVMGGHIPASVSVMGEVMHHIKSGRLRGLAVSSPQRSRFLPDIPTFTEHGFKEVDVEEWLGWFVPARTPMQTVLRLNALVREGMQAPEFTETLGLKGMEARYQSSSAFAETVRTEHERWTPVVKATGFIAED